MKSRNRIFVLSPIKMLLSLFATMVILCLTSMSAFAVDEQLKVTGQLYEFDKNNHYEFPDGGSVERTNKDNTYGTFCISGNIVAVNNKDGVPSYEVSDDKLTFYYNHGDSMLNANEDAWHLIDDKSKKVADMKLDDDIMKGAIILQTSKDRKNWVDVKTTCNAFGDTPVRTDSIYSATEVELNNGCFYRVIIVYELSIRTEDSNFLFINTDKYDFKKCAEVYEFYAKTKIEDNAAVVPGDGYRLGDKVRVEKHDGYFGQKEIEKGDLHYGDNGEWDLGNFFVSGHTDEVVESNGNVVFLKNVGDKVTLWFNLEQNIDALDGNENLSITADGEGRDQYFGTGTMNFGRGALIIRKTDHNNNRGDAQIYTNYLEANTSVGADTIVRLCEEGDYEVALDYEITSDELIDKIGHYRIFFKFSVRNGNCMFYLRDVKTGSELANGSMTENGFQLDLAKSRYLKLNLKRETLKDSANGLIEDTRFNGPAKDGAEYTDEGIYTITVSNEYTGQSTTKKIYVGTNNILRAYMKTGLSISEINSLVANGATISDDGTIQPAAQSGEMPNLQEPPISAPTPEASASSTSETEIISNGQETSNSESNSKIVVVIGVLTCVLVVACVVLTRKKQAVKATADQQNEEGGVKQ